MTGRPAMAVGTFGNISAKRTPAGTWQASAYYRDIDGSVRRVRKTGRTKAAAVGALREDMSVRTTPTGPGDITRETKVGALVDRWLDSIADSARSVQTRHRYAQVARAYLVPKLGELRLREVSTSRIDRTLGEITTENGAPTARVCRIVLGQVFTLAVNHDAITHHPVQHARTVRVEKRDPRALTGDDLAAMRTAAQRWASEQRKGGAPRFRDLPDVVDMLIATGGRIGETLAVRWSDVDLDAGTVTLNGSVIPSGKTAGGAMRQDHRKGGAEALTLALPAFAVAMLMRRSVEAPEWNPLDAVFPGRTGNWLDPDNVRKHWRAVRPEGLEWVTPHSLRRTVATALERVDGLDAAARQLGHAGTAMTQRHYVERVSVVADHRHTLDSLAPSQ